MRNSRKGSADEAFVFCVLVVLCVGFISWNVSWDYGHDRGVRDALAGKYTVVEMPDGTSRVCAVKKEASK